MNKFFNNKGQLASIEEKWLDGVIIKQDIKGNSVIDCNCSRCGGTGKLDQFYHVENGTCFKCNGSGREEKNMKLYSQEKAETLVKRYKDRQEKKYQEFLKNRESALIITIQKHFNIENELYIVVENNSFEIKEELKKEGFKYKNFGWYSNKDSEKYKTVCIMLDELIDLNDMDINYNNIYSILDEYKKLNNQSSYLGDIKDKLELNVTLDYYNSYEGYAYNTTTYYYNFKDKDGNKLQWKTNKSLGIPVGAKCTLKGTIKELKEDKEYDKITVVTRCKIIYDNSKDIEEILNIINNKVKDINIVDYFISSSEISLYDINDNCFDIKIDLYQKYGYNTVEQLYEILENKYKQ